MQPRHGPGRPSPAVSLVPSRRRNGPRPRHRGRLARRGDRGPRRPGARPGAASTGRAAHHTVDAIADDLARPVRCAPRRTTVRRAAWSASASRSPVSSAAATGWSRWLPTSAGPTCRSARSSRPRWTRRARRRRQRGRPGRARRASARGRDGRRRRPLHLRRGRRRWRAHRRRPAARRARPATAARSGTCQSYPSGRRVAAARSGCWETEVGEEALLARSGRSRETPDGRRRRVLRDAEAGVEPALAALDDVGRWLGVGLAGLVNILNPRADRARRPVLAGSIPRARVARGRAGASGPRGLREPSFGSSPPRSVSMLRCSGQPSSRSSPSSPTRPPGSGHVSARCGWQPHEPSRRIPSCHVVRRHRRRTHERGMPRM